MRTKQGNKPQFVVCIDNSGYLASSDLHKIYRTVPGKRVESDGDIRVIDESGEDYLYAQSRFVPIKISAELEQSLVESR